MTHLAPVVQTRALAPVVPIPSPDTAAAILRVAEALQPDLAQGFQIDALRLRAEMEQSLAALVLFLRKYGRALLARAGSHAALLPILAKVSGLLSTHTRRSEKMERFQQSSTPLPIGLAALAAAQITPRDLVLELSAGTGLLATLAEIVGGSLVLNELTDTRADLLRLLFPGRPVTQIDAAQIDDHRHNLTAGSIRGRLRGSLGRGAVDRVGAFIGDRQGPARARRGYPPLQGGKDAMSDKEMQYFIQPAPETVPVIGLH
jgi:hypothetical protein